MTTTTYTIGSLFDGSGGFPLAAQQNGMKALWASEVNEFRVSVTKRHFPQMEHLGDVTEVRGDQVDPVDVVTFGSPCQDLSIAGTLHGRAGLDGARSSLFFEAVRIINEMREATDGRYPRFGVWENVPGALSSNKGEDFRCVLEALARVVDKGAAVPRPPRGKWTTSGVVAGDGWSIAWRVLDAQYFGVAQRRRRIVALIDFGSERAADILFECESVSGGF
jgi:DNA (cytosine-5)-methyltransferase 1